MSGIAIYMEGGGDGANGRAALRRGMDALLKPLKDIAQRERLRWRLTVCGGRDAAFKAFRNAANGNDVPHRSVHLPRTCRTPQPDGVVAMTAQTLYCRQSPNPTGEARDATTDASAGRNTAKRPHAPDRTRRD